MKKKLLIIFVSILFISIISFFYIDIYAPQKRSAEIDGLTSALETKIKQDVPCLAQMEALYNLVFTHFRERKIISDEIYYRRDLATVYYGYPMDKTNIKITADKNGELVLHVSLPNPKEIAIDKETKQLDCTHKDYTPSDNNGREINIEKVINRKLALLRRKYEPKSIEKTKELSQMYFKALAKRYGLKLELEFLNG